MTSSARPAARDLPPGPATPAAHAHGPDHVCTGNGNGGQCSGACAGKTMAPPSAPSVSTVAMPTSGRARPAGRGTLLDPAPPVMPPIRLDPRLLARYDVNGPRYTSYPTALQFNDAFTMSDYAAAAAQSKRTGRPLSLYLHVPFCDTVCFYCACTKIVTRNHAHADDYVARLHWEIARQASLVGAGRVLDQMHWGGGTPTFLSLEQITALIGTIARHFVMPRDDSAEYSIEIDPRSAGPATIRALRELGFNRLSIGVQDFDPRVQEAIHRVQPREMVEAALDAARDSGFRSVNMDLIYGLPHQTTTSFARTLDAVIEMSPERLSVFSYAHLPQQFKMQGCMPETAMPSGPEKLALLQSIIERLTDAGYVYIGMDHFARPDDELAQALAAGTLHRNFQGYSTRADCDLVGVGMSAIGRVGDSYAQNAKTLDDYYDAIDAGGLAVRRGVRLTHEDRVRRDVISHLMCRMQVDFAEIERTHDLRFVQYFGAELGELASLARDGLVAVDPQRIRILPAGRLLVRVVAQVFDRYRRERQSAQCAKVM